MRISPQYDVGLSETMPEVELRMGEVVARMVRRRVRVKVFMVIEYGYNLNLSFTISHYGPRPMNSRQLVHSMESH